jgi:hypothetical protein
MSVQIKNPKAIWYVKMMEQFNTLMQRLSMPEDAQSEIKTMFLEVAKDQYMAGNRSGIRWQREQSGLPVRSNTQA